MEARGWAELDFVLISGDAYVDHPSFAPAVIGRFLESRGIVLVLLPNLIGMMLMPLKN